MCGRMIIDYETSFPVAEDDALAEWALGIPEGAESSWNVTPTQSIPVALTSAKDGLRRFVLAHWGIIPPWSRDGKTRSTFNARVEDLLTKPTFAPAVEAQRCVVPVTGFYEWTGPKGSRTPHAIFGTGRVLPLAGLYRWWRAPAGEWRLTATVLTRPSAGAMAGIHDRMPVFMDDGLLRDWLDPRTAGDQALVDATAAASSRVAERLTTYPVRPLGEDGPELIARL